MGAGVMACKSLWLSPGPGSIIIASPAYVDHVSVGGGRACLRVRMSSCVVRASQSTNNVWLLLPRATSHCAHPWR